MSTTSKQDKAFNIMVGNELSAGLLQSCIDWIRDNMNPDAVFETAQLKKFIANTCMPDGVFTEDELKQWAIDHGFVPAPKVADPNAYDYSVNDKTIFE